MMDLTLFKKMNRNITLYNNSKNKPKVFSFKNRTKSFNLMGLFVFLHTPETDFWYRLNEKINIYPNIEINLIKKLKLNYNSYNLL